MAILKENKSLLSYSVSFLILEYYSIHGTYLNPSNFVYNICFICYCPLTLLIQPKNLFSFVCSHTIIVFCVHLVTDYSLVNLFTPYLLQARYLPSCEYAYPRNSFDSFSFSIISLVSILSRFLYVKLTCTLLVFMFLLTQRSHQVS